MISQGFRNIFATKFGDAVIRLHDAGGNVIEAHEHAGDVKER